MDERSAVVAYLPRTVAQAAARSARAGTPGDQRVELVQGTLLFADVSGFTRLSERLARLGRAGAEEMVSALSAVFGPLVDVVHAHGGDVLKFSGDALFVLFRGEDHCLRAAAAAGGLRQVLRRVGSVRTAGGAVRLSMSQGLHSGSCWLVHAGTGSFRDVVAVGPAVTATYALESAAEAGEVLLGPEAERLLRGRVPDAVGRRADGAAVLLGAPSAPPPPPSPGAGWSEGLAAYVPAALRGRLAEVVADSEHRTVSTAFVPFTGCDALLAEHGIDEVARRLDALLDATAELADRHHVTVVCVDAGPDGGKLMLVAGAPDADEREAEAMLLLCLDLVAADPGLALRAGVNRGGAYAGLVGGPQRFTWSSMGDPVNVAARLAGRAAPGEVVAGEQVLAQAPDRFDVDPLPPLRLKGKSQPVRAAVVRRARAVRAGRSAVPFVGRAPELAELAGALQRAVAGQGALVEVVGHPGVGKTRLLDELRLRGPERTLRLRCERHDVGRAYAAAEVLLRSALGIPSDASPQQAGEALLAWLARRRPGLLPLAPLVAAALGADVPPTPEVDAIAEEFRVPRLRDAVEEVLVAAGDGPVLILLEDVGLMDEASSGLLTSALRGLAARPWLVVTTRRPGQHGLGEQGVQPVRELALEPLPEVEAHDLARRAGDGLVPQADLERLVRRSGGNPLFLLELVRAWRDDDDADGLPDTVEAIIAARIDRLPPRPRRLLRYASVLGERVDLELLLAALDGAEPSSPITQARADARTAQTWQQLEELLPAHGASTRRFGHDLVRRVAYDSLSFARRRQLHARAGAALEAAGSEDLALLAQHFAEAGDCARTWRYALAAGDSARRRFAHAEAADLYQRAVDAALASGEVPVGEVAAVAERLGDSAEVAGRYAQAAAAYTTGRRLAPAGDVPRLLGKQGRLSERTGRYRQALGWYTRALRALEGLAPSARRAATVDLLVGRAGVLLRQGRYDEVVATCRLALDAADERADRAGFATACFLLDAALTDLGQEEEATRWRARALPVFEELGDLGRQADVLNNLGIDAYYAGRLDEALDYYERSRVARARAGDVVGAATAGNNIAEVLSDQGRLEEAEAAFSEALAVWTRAGYPVGAALATSNLGRLRTRQGRAPEALPLLHEALESFRGLGAEALAVDTEARLAEALLAAGRAPAALALCEDLLGARRRAPGVAQVVEALEQVRDAARRLSGVVSDETSEIVAG